MEETMVMNKAELCGTVARAPAFSHASRGEDFYSFAIDVQRLSGTVDTINVLAREDLLRSTPLSDGEKLFIRGQLRSFNNKSGTGSRLVISIFAKELCFTDQEDLNTVSLVGALCKPPNYRITPMGREICDLMVAVNRPYGRSDYLPCIAWGTRAKAASRWEVGQSVALTGRFQSRRYIKLQDGLSLEKTAYEVSVVNIEAVEN